MFLKKIKVSNEFYESEKKKNRFFRFLLFLAGIEIEPCPALEGRRYAIFSYSGRIMKLETLPENKGLSAILGF